MLGCVWERYSSMRVFHELLDTLTQQDYAYPTALIGSTGLTSCNPPAQSRTHRGFFVRNTQLFIMSGCVGSRKTGRFGDPVCQPAQSGSMFDIMASGLQPNHRSQS